MSECQKVLRAENKPYPRTCAVCGLGPCKNDISASPEPSRSPMGWYYRVDRGGSNNPVLYRCKLGSAWERPEVYDITEMTPDELRYVADVIDASKAQAA